MVIARTLFGLLLVLGIVLLISFGCSDDSEQVLVDAGADDALVEASAPDVMPWWDEGISDSVVGGEEVLPPEDAEAPADLSEHTDLDMATD